MSRMIESIIKAVRALALAFGASGLAIVAAAAHDGHGENENENSEHGRNRYVVRNLVSDGFVDAEKFDANLRNSWGIAFNPTGVWWVNDNHARLATLYDQNGTINSLVVNIPGA